MFKPFLFLSLILANVRPSVAYAGILVRHSQSTQIPFCPPGYTRLWSGFSYTGTVLEKGGGSSQDLSSAGSCLNAFRSAVIVKCYNESNCDRLQGGYVSLWLWGRMGNLPGRCAVCEGSYTAIAVHTQMSTLGRRCPKGWRAAWSGYSFEQFRVRMQNRLTKSLSFATDVGDVTDLGKSGSCLPVHMPSPHIQCVNSRCTRINSNYKSFWVSTFYKTGAETTAFGSSRLNMISRCSVCYK